MSNKTWLWALAALAAVVLAVVATRNAWSPERAAAQQGGQRVVPVEVAKAEKKAMPVRLEALGTVTPMASVAIKPRLETVITEVHFQDGASVKVGDLLFKLDGRQLEAEIKRVEAVIAGAQAQFEQAERDVQRYSELIAKNATTQVTLNNSLTQANISRATAESNRAMLENLRVQLDFTSIRAPISGRISAASVKVGNFVRPADTAPLATINQMAPVYVSFGVPQRTLPDLRKSLAAQGATVEAVVPGDPRRASGQVSMVENTVDPTTGMVMARATMDNANELLWPGTLVSTQLTLRIENAVVVPAVAVQVSQTGSFVFVVQDGAARVRPVTVARTLDNQAVISAGLEGDETVVVDGQLLLVDGTRVAPRQPKGAGA